MSKTFSASEVADRWQDIVEEATTHGEAIVQTEGAADVVVVPIERYAKMNGTKTDEALARIWADVDRDLAVLKEPGTSEKLREIFASTPEQIAAAANDAARRNR